jgi:hypothetical protein
MAGRSLEAEMPGSDVERVDGRVVPSDVVPHGNAQGTKKKDDFERHRNHP